jgi:hypothetical protein
MKTLILFFLIGICSTSFAQRGYNADYTITLKDGRVIPVYQNVWKDAEKYVVASESQHYYTIPRSEITSESEWLANQPNRKVMTAGTLLRQGGNSLIVGTFIGVLGTTTALLLPTIAPKTEKYAGYIGAGVAVVSITISIHAFGKISKAGSFLDAKKL